MQEYLPLPSAAKSAGVPVRTLRYWVTSGKLTAKKGKRGYLVRLTDVQGVAALARAKEPIGAATPEPETNQEMRGPDAALVSPAARAQLAAVMEEWITPLMDRIAALERENGQLEERLTTATRERDAAIEARTEHGPPESVSHSAAEDTPIPNKPRSFWSRLFGDR